MGVAAARSARSRSVLAWISLIKLLPTAGLRVSLESLDKQHWLRGTCKPCWPQHKEGMRTTYLISLAGTFSCAMKIHRPFFVYKTQHRSARLSSPLYFAPSPTEISKSVRLYLRSRKPRRSALLTMYEESRGLRIFLTEFGGSSATCVVPTGADDIVRLACDTVPQLSLKDQMPSKREESPNATESLR